MPLLRGSTFPSFLLFARSLATNPRSFGNPLGFIPPPFAAPAVTLRLELPVRKLINPYSRTIVLKLDKSPRPLSDVRSALRERLHPHYESDVVDALNICHGKRILQTDFQLLDLAMKLKPLEPVLNVVHNPLAPELPEPPPDGSPPATLPLPPDIGPLRLVSFFKFVPLDETRRLDLVPRIRSILARLNCRGTVYVAAEGLNGQLCVPENKRFHLEDELKALKDLERLRLNIQHESLGRIDYQPGSPPPYRKLIVREKPQILTDGLPIPEPPSPVPDVAAAELDDAAEDDEDDDDGKTNLTPSAILERAANKKAKREALIFPQSGLGGAAAEVAQALDWSKSGTELDAKDWHKMLLQRDSAAASGEGEAKATAKKGRGKKAKASPSAPLLIDCRNDYETEEGTFEGAVPLGTTKFSESWDAWKSKLKGVPKDQPIMTFCTGGIRCVKTNAYLEQELGFTNTYRLKDGIHGYLRHARNDLKKGESKWRGENFVFYESDRSDLGDEEAK